MSWTSLARPCGTQFKNRSSSRRPSARLHINKRACVRSDNPQQFVIFSLFQAHAKLTEMYGQHGIQVILHIYFRVWMLILQPAEATRTERPSKKINYSRSKLCHILFSIRNFPSHSPLFSLLLSCTRLFSTPAVCCRWETMQ